jgi:hypothetical protein
LPGVEEDNFQGDELDNFINGGFNKVLQKYVLFFINYNVQESKGSQGSLAHQMHVVAFFVHPSLDEAVMERLQTYYTKITGENSMFSFPFYPSPSLF